MKIDPAYFDAVIDRAGTACEKWDGRQGSLRPRRRHPPLGGGHGLCLRPGHRRGAQGARRPPHLRLYGRCGGKPAGGGKLPQAPLWPGGGAGMDPFQPQRGGQHALFPLRADRAGRARAHPAAGVRPLPRDDPARRPRRGRKPAGGNRRGLEDGLWLSGSGVPKRHTLHVPLQPPQPRRPRVDARGAGNARGTGQGLQRARHRR